MSNVIWVVIVYKFERKGNEWNFHLIALKIKLDIIFRSFTKKK